MQSLKEGMDDVDVVEIIEQPDAEVITSVATSFGPATSEASTSSKISFGVRKKKENVDSSLNLFEVDKKGVDEEDHDVEETKSKKRHITNFDGSFMERDEDTDSKFKSLVIPLVVEKDWRVKKILEKKKKEGLKPEEEAKLALLIPSADAVASAIDGENVSLNGPSDIEADYGAVPVEAFGLALLRGCSWKDGDGIGKNKRVVPLKLPERRPKGLGLGNDIKLFKKSVLIASKEQNGEDELALKKGCYVEIKSGSCKNRYGQVESFDEDNASVIVKLALTKKNVRVSEYAIKVVSKAEYERNSKIINRKAFDEAKDKIDEEYSRKNSSQCSNDKKRSHWEKPKMPKQMSASETKKHSTRQERMWVRPELKVRFIDKKYKSGKLFNEKVVVVDAADRENCTVQDSHGKIHYQILEEWLETVIPSEGSRIMVVGGKWSGSLARLEVKDRKNERVIARILHSDEMTDISYDDVCEFVGTVDIDDY